MGALSFLGRIVGWIYYIWYALLKLPLLNYLDKILYSVGWSGYRAIEEQPNTLEGFRFQHAWVTVNRVRLHYAWAGEAKNPLMLFVHGFPENWYSWRHQMAHFAETHYVVAVDMRGYNLSEKPANRTDYAVTTLVADVENLILALRKDKCILVAHDWGGAVAWRAAYEIPHRIQRLIICNSPHTINFFHHLATNDRQLKASWYMLAFQIPLLPEFIMRHAIQGIFSNSLNNPGLITPADNEEFVTAMRRPGALTASINWYRNMYTPAAHPSTHVKLSTPTLLIWGQLDFALLEEINQGTERHFTNPSLFRFEPIPNASHWVQQDAPNEVNRLIQQFISV